MPKVIQLINSGTGDSELMFLSTNTDPVQM